LPHVETASRWFGVALHGIEMHRDEHARAACRPLNASAFAVGNVVVFSEESPSVALVLHEVAHVLQQDALGRSTAARFAPGSLTVADSGSRFEREASLAHLPALHRSLSRAPIAVYRDTPEAKVEGAVPPAETPTDVTIPDDITDVAGKRLWLFAAYSDFKAVTQASPRFGVRKATETAISFEALGESSPRPWKREHYVAFFIEKKALLEGAKLKPVTETTAGSDLNNFERRFKRLGISRVRRYENESPQFPFAFTVPLSTSPPDQAPLPYVTDLHNAEARLLEFKANKDYAPSEAGNFYFIPGVVEGGEPLRKFPQGSLKSFTAETYRAAFPAKPDGDEDFSDPQGDLPKVMSLPSRSVFGLVRIGKDDTSRTYAFVAGASYPESGFVSSTQKVEKNKKSNAERLKDYKAILETIKKAQSKKVGDVTLPERNPKDTSEEVHPTDPSKNRPNDGDVRYARHALMELVLNAYGANDQAAFFKDIIGGGGTDPFGRSYARIKGNLFEKWVFTHRYTSNPNVRLESKQPFFQWDKDPLSGRFQKTRLGDGVLISTKDETTLNVIWEAKAYTAAKVPTLGNEKTDVKDATKDDDLVLQMKDYKTILTPPGIKAWYLAPSTESTDDDSDSEVEDNPKQKAAPLTPAQITFKYILYEFGDVSVAEKWRHALKTTLTPYYTTAPQLEGDAAAKEVALTIGLNPPIPITLKEAANKTDFQVTEFKTHPPGLRLRQANIKLALPGRPLLAAGSSMTVDVGLGEMQAEGGVKLPGGIQQQGVVKPIEPVSSVPGEKPKPGQKPLDGRAENKFTDLESTLDRFLQRVTYSARVVDRGVEADVGISDGPSGIPGVDIVGTIIKASYKQGTGLKVAGQVGLQRTDGKIRGKVSVAYENEDWTYSGEVTVANLIQGLEPFTATVYVRGEERRIGADKVKISRTIGGVALDGSLTKVLYDLEKKSFSADVSLGATLKLFGKFGATGRVENDELQKLTFTYDSPEFAFPKGQSAILRGSVSGAFSYEKGKFSGDLGGTAFLKIAALEKIEPTLGNLGFVIDAHLGSEGQFSGSIALAEDKPIALGSYLRVPQLRLALHEDGAVSSTFSLEVVAEKLKYVKEARISCEITREGKFKVAAANVKLKVGDESKDRVAAELGLEYARQTEAFIITGKVWIRIKKGVVAIGTLTYNMATGKVDASLTVAPITLLDWNGKKSLLDLKKQIELVSFYKIIGVYLDVRFALSFKYEFKLSVATSVKLEGLDIETFEFALAIASVKLSGALVAILEGTPGLGLGLFVISTRLLRGGGGIKVPIAARAAVTPEGTIVIKYRPDGTIEGGSRVGLTLTFGIKAAIKPYAEFSVLDGAWEPNWEGEALAEFPIMAERELFTYFLDFGTGLEPQQGEPKLPSGEKGKAPPAKESNEKQRIGTERSGEKSEEPPKGLRNAEAPEKPQNEPEKGKKEGGFDFMQTVEKLLNAPKFAPIKKALNAAADTWEAISGFFKKVINFFKQWFDIVKEGIDAFIEAIRFIAEHGLIAFFKKLLKRALGALYDIVAPLFDALEKIAGKFEDRLDKLLETPIPLTPLGFLGWVIDVLADVLSIGVSSVVDMAEAVGQVISNAAAAGGRFINYLVKQGKVGVRRHVYYIPGIPYVRDRKYFYAPTEYKIDIWGFERHEKVDGDLVGLSDLVSPSRIVHKAIAYLLWLALNNITEVQYTNDVADDEDVKDDSRKNFWA
jgi:hypothetical protein